MPKTKSKQYKASKKINLFTSRNFYIAIVLLLAVVFGIKQLKSRLFQSADINLISTNTKIIYDETGKVATTDPNAKVNPQPTNIPCTPGKLDQLSASGSCGTLGFMKYSYTCSNGNSSALSNGVCVEMGDALIEIQKVCSPNCQQTPQPSTSSPTSSVKPISSPNTNQTLYDQCVASRCAVYKGGTSDRSKCVNLCRSKYPIKY